MILKVLSNVCRNKQAVPRLNIHTTSKVDMKKGTPKCNEKDNFHKALPNVKKAYVTLRKFTPNLKIFYTDISAISVTLHYATLHPTHTDRTGHSAVCYGQFYLDGHNERM